MIYTWGITGFAYDVAKIRECLPQAVGLLCDLDYLDGTLGDGCEGATT